MTVQVAFQRSDGGWVHRVICAVTGSEFAHCEIVINGRGYTPKRNRKRLYSRDPIAYDTPQWVLVPIKWDAAKVRRYVLAHQGTGYDMQSLFAYLLPLFRDHHIRQNCSEFVVNLGSFCGDPLFHNLDASRFSPGDVYRLLTGERR